MKIELPTRYDIGYPKRNIKYYSTYGKRKLVKKLYASCNGYCMYCGKTVRVDGDKNFHLEHSVDKKGNIHQEIDSNNVLEHCKFNLAIACEKCNTVCKKVVDKVDLINYEPLLKCSPKCEKMCEPYSKIRAEYMRKNAIILQPKGIQDPIPYLISYDLLKHIYVPEGVDEQDEVLFFIQNHIDRFELNGERFSTCIIDLCSKLVCWYENGIKDINSLLDALNNENHSNILGEKFTSFIKEYYLEKTAKKLIDFCRLLVILDAVS